MCQCFDFFSWVRGCSHAPILLVLRCFKSAVVRDVSQRGLVNSVAFPVIVSSCFHGRIELYTIHPNAFFSPNALL